MITHDFLLIFAECFGWVVGGQGVHDASCSCRRGAQGASEDYRGSPGANLKVFYDEVTGNYWP